MTGFSSDEDEMAVPLLKTKLYIPLVRPGFVPRPRLIEQLNAGAHRKLTLISAPAGFGKTTLLGEWIQQSSVPVAWVSLDKGDNDPARFWAYFVAALQTMQASIGKAALEVLPSSKVATIDRPSIEGFLTGLINDIAEISGPFVLVLDDFHLIAEQRVHQGIAFLLDNLPPQMHLTLSGRADPPWPFARLRARGEVTELRLDDLRFNLEQATAFLNNVMRLDLSPEDVAALGVRTEGWIAGLQMAALSMQRRRQRQGAHDVSAFIEAFTGSDRFILDYLMEEVLDGQSPDILEFLLRTCILDRLTAPLCDAVLENSQIGKSANELIADFHSREALEYLERANLFVVPLDGRREWYRYHRLFADLLRSRLRQAHRDLVPRLHCRASEWYEQNGLIAEAIDHALSAEDFERAAHLIEQVAEATLMRSEVATLLRWVEALPDELVRARTTLCLYHAWALLLSGRPLDAVESRLQDIDWDADLTLGRLAPLRAFVSVFQGQVPRATELSRQALERLPEDELFLRSMAAWNLAISYMLSGDVAAGSQALDEAARMSQKAGNVMIAVMTLCNLAELHMSQGRLGEARVTYQRALGLATDQQGQPLPIADMALMGLGELWRERNDLEAATRYIAEGIQRIRQWGEIGALDGYVSLARIRQAQGDVDGARDAIQKAQQLAIKFDATEMDDLMVAMHQVRLWTAQGDIKAALRWVEERGLGVVIGAAEPEELEETDSFLDYQLRKREYIALARVLIAQDRPQEALSLLEPLVPMMEQRGNKRRVIELEILKALALQAQGHGAQSLIALEHALSLAEPGGYVRVFADEGPPMARLLYQAAAHGIATEYVGRLLRAFDVESFSLQRATCQPETLIEPLSARERSRCSSSSPRDCPIRRWPSE